MLDTRFPPSTKRITIPLYPSQSQIEPSLFFKRLNTPLHSYLADYYKVPKEQIFLSATGSISLSLFLSYISKGKIGVKVALPAFCCPEVCHAILRASCMPVFLEIDFDFFISEKSIQFAGAQGCQVLIWPHFFGTRKFPEKSLALIHKLGLIFINDEAQSFPDWEGESPIAADVTLFSFGPSKKLAGIGGGGICIRNPKTAADFFSQLQMESNPCTCWQYLKNAMKAKVRLFDHSISTWLSFSAPLETDLQMLLEKRPFPLISPEEITPLQMKIAYLHLLKYRNSAKRFLQDLEKMKETVKDVFGESALRWIKDIKYPSIFALDLSFNKQNLSRREVFTFLAEHHIQATWYYLPLNQLNFLKQYPTELTNKSIEIASQILILPFQWTHSGRMGNILRTTILDILRNYTQTTSKMGAERCFLHNP